ncbi:Ankyrin [Ectocarpus siliculosus]|uniref:Ankyrin n=1 Tax=Ectocarpus siliculosus TaxID=2880 RepID=D8LMA9_ECTSI|nr:Ankyrin [Ectocarpus siliculosus]|eukprot:CBN77519.1 Ankyrin [Ectocarpus siliculosus]
MLEEGASVHDFGDAVVRPIAVATDYGLIDIIKALVATGADTEAPCWSDKDGAWKGNPEWSYRNGFTALYIAPAVGNAGALLVLLQLGANPNATDSDGGTPIMVTCGTGSVTSTKLTMMRSLLKAGADLAVENELGGLAIHIAAGRCDAQVVALLLSMAPSTLNNATHNGLTPLAAAAEKGNESTMSLLFSEGASDSLPWATTGITALHKAVIVGMGTSVRFLLENGLDAVGGLPGIAEAIRISVWFGCIDGLEMLLNVHGEKKQEFWAKHYVFGVQDDSLLGSVPFSITAILCEWYPILHYAAKHYSIPALHVLLSAGAIPETCDF